MPMALSQSKYSLRSVSSDEVKLSVEAEFCLTSSDECVAELTEKAIANSFKLETLSSRITLIDERLELAEDRIKYTKNKKSLNSLK